MCRVMQGKKELAFDYNKRGKTSARQIRQNEPHSGIHEFLLACLLVVRFISGGRPVTALPSKSQLRGNRLFGGAEIKLNSTMRRKMDNLRLFC